MEDSPPSQDHVWTFSRVVWATLVIALIAFGFWLFYRFYQVAFILFITIVMGTVIRPVSSWLNRRGIPHTIGVLLVFLVLLGLLVGFVLLLVPLIVDQGTVIAASLPDYYQNLHDSLANSPNQLLVSLSELLPTALPAFGLKLQTQTQVLASAETAIGYVTTTVKVLFVAVAVLLLTFHWTLGGQQNIFALLQLIPKNKREGISDLVTAMETKIGYFILGQTVLCLVIGVMALIAYLSIGLPNALILALIAGLMEAVPVIGPFLGAIPAGIIAFSISPLTLLWVVLATIIIQQLENNLLVPRVMRKAVGVNPFVTLLAIFAFSSLFGVAGALMAIPLAAMIQLLLDRFVFHPVEVEPEESPGRDITSRLSYEAKDLAGDLRKQARHTKRGSVRHLKQVDKVMDEIESITTDLDALLAQVPSAGDE